MKKLLLITGLLIILTGNSFSQIIYSETANPVYDVDYASGVNGLCILCGVVNPAHAADNNKNNYATMVVPAAVGGNLSFILKLSSTATPGNYAGFLVERWSGLIDISVLSTMTIKTFMNGIHTDTKSGAAIEIVNMGSGLQSLSFLSNTSFNEIEITIEGLVSVANTMNVYYAYGGSSIPLPVTLESFTGKQNSRGILLEWTTISEINSEEFELQHSSDGTNFETLAIINNTQNSTGSSYTYTDEDPLIGKNYYRLQLVNYNDQFTYSDILLVENKTASDKINVYASSDGLVINNNSAEEEIYAIQVMNLAGTTIMTTEITLGSGSSTVLRGMDEKTGMFLIKTKDMASSGSLHVFKVQF